MNLYIYNYSVILKKPTKNPNPRTNHTHTVASSLQQFTGHALTGYKLFIYTKPQMPARTMHDLLGWDGSAAPNWHSSPSYLGTIVPLAFKEAPSRAANLTWCLWCPCFILPVSAGTVHRLKVTTLFWRLHNSVRSLKTECLDVACSFQYKQKNRTGGKRKIFSSLLF